MEIIDFIGDIIADPVQLAPFAAMISVSVCIVALAWPIIEQQKRRLRLSEIRTAEARMRDAATAGRAAKNADPIDSLRHAAPKKIYTAIIERLNLNRLLQNPKTLDLIYKAGFRGEAAAIKITAMRVILAVFFASGTALYIWVIVNLKQPIALRLLIVGAAALFGWWAPIIYLKNRFQNRRTDIRRNWPDAMDLLLICVESGMSVEAAFRKVAEEIAAQSVVLSEELSLTTAELNYLQDRQNAYRRLYDRTEVDEVRSVVTSLIQSDKYGTPVGRALRVLSAESRALRMAAAEKKAAALPPKLTVPMILFFLPVLFAVIMTPAIIQLMQD
jgi:tight adherence protein C